MYSTCLSCSVVPIPSPSHESRDCPLICTTLHSDLCMSQMSLLGLVQMSLRKRADSASRAVWMELVSVSLGMAQLFSRLPYWFSTTVGWWPIHFYIVFPWPSGFPTADLSSFPVEDSQLLSYASFKKETERQGLELERWLMVKSSLLLQRTWVGSQSGSSQLPVNSALGPPLLSSGLFRDDLIFFLTFQVT